MRHGSFLETVLLREKQLLYNDPNGQLLVYDEQLVSDPIPFSSGGNGVRLVGDLLTQIQLDGFSNESMAARSDFLSTARIAYLEVRDPSGNLIDVSAVGGSGHVYPVNIPEPGCLVGLALAACLWVRRRPVSARHARAA